MTSYIVVLDGADDPDLWNYVAEADRLDALLSLCCLGGAALPLSKREHPGRYIQAITKKSCEAPDVQVSGKIYALA